MIKQILIAIDQLINAIFGGWAGMLNFERDSEELVELAAAFGMSATQVDDLFCFAETIK